MKTRILYHPDELVEGKLYKIRYKSNDKTQTEIGRFIQMIGEKIHDCRCLWLWFAMQSVTDPKVTYNYPMLYGPDMKFREIK